MGYQASGSTDTQVTMNIKLTKEGRERLIYGSGSNIAYFTLHDEGINYTSTAKPSRGRIPEAAGTLSSNTGVADGQGFRDVILRQVPTNRGDLIEQTGVKHVKFGVSSKGWGSEIGLTANTTTYNKLNVTVNLDYAINFMKWLAGQVEQGSTLDYSMFYDTNNHPASSFKDGFLNLNLRVLILYFIGIFFFGS